MSTPRWTVRAVAVVAAVVSCVVGRGQPALASRGGGNTTSTSSLELVLLDSTDGVAHWGQRVTFKVTTTATDQPQVNLDCFQAGTRVFTMWTGYWDGYKWPWTQVMTLESGAWTGGAADCVATMYYSSGRKTVTGATLEFHVDA